MYNTQTGPLMGCALIRLVDTSIDFWGGKMQPIPSWRMRSRSITLVQHSKYQSNNIIGDPHE